VFRSPTCRITGRKTRGRFPDFFGPKRAEPLRDFRIGADFFTHIRQLLRCSSISPLAAGAKAPDRYSSSSRSLPVHMFLPLQV